MQTELTDQKENILNKIIMEIHDCVKNKVTNDLGILFEFNNAII